MSYSNRLRRIISGYLAIFRLRLLLSTALTTIAGILMGIKAMNTLDYYLILLALLLILGTLLAHIAMHALDDYLDVVEGLDKGLPRELYTVFGYYYSPIVEGKVSLRETLAVAIVSLIGGLAVGIYLTLERGIAVLVFAGVGALIILTYHSILLAIIPGEVALFLKDFLTFLGSYYVISQRIDMTGVTVAIAISTAHIVYALNKIPRASYDRERGRKTLASILGKRIWIAYAIISLIMALSLLISVKAGFMPLWSLIALICLASNVRTTIRLRDESTLRNVSVLKKLADNNQLSLLAYKLVIVSSLLPLVLVIILQHVFAIKI